MEKVALIYATEKITAKTIFVLFDDHISVGTVNRMLASARKKANVPPYGFLSVDSFITLYNLPRETSYYKII